MKRMEKALARLVALAIALGGSGCADRYADYRSVLENERALMGDFIAEAREALDAEALTRGIERLNGGLQDLAARLNKLEQDHPELADLAAVPPELKPEMEGLEKSVADLDKLLLDKEKLFFDPQVKKALQDLLDLRGSLGL